jgi:Amt family ammonium transporter
MIEAMTVLKSEQVYDLAGMCNGVLAGLVAVCAGVGSFEPGVAAAIGMMGAMAYELGHWVLVKYNIDDPLDAFSVHGMGGIMGLIMRPLVGMDCLALGWDGVIGTNSDNDQILVMDMWLAHISGTLVICAWSGGIAALIFVPCKFMKMLTYTGEEQVKGSDVHCSPPKAYNMEAETTTAGTENKVVEIPASKVAPAPEEEAKPAPAAPNESEK